jgi:5-amino-6-(5-phosphoribosylamino)uracil reductase
VAVNFVSSVDGAVSVDGLSGGLSSPGDKRIFSLGRDYADVVLVSSGTAVAENYRPAPIDGPRAERRLAAGLMRELPIAIVTPSGSFPLDAGLLAGPTLIFTTTTGYRQWPGAEVFTVGEAEIDFAQVFEILAQRKLFRVICEGGPRLLGELITHDFVDEIRLTVQPMAVAGQAGRISVSEQEAVRRLELASVLEEDGSLFLRYVRSTFESVR